MITNAERVSLPCISLHKSMKSFKDFINETYRITRRRRDFLDTEYADAQRGADAAFDGSNKIRGIQSAIYHSATQARIDAIRDMALPVDKRTTILGTPGPDDAQLKQDMKTARKTQQRIKLAQRTV